MRYEDLSVEQTKALLDAIRELIRNPPEGELDDAALLALLPGRVTEADTGAGPGVDPAPGPDPAPETTPQGVFQFSVPVSGWGAEAYRLHWGDESVEIAQSRGNRASLADIETALESLHGIRDVEVTAPGLADIIEGTGGRPYRVAIIDADPDTFRVTKGNGKNASVRIVDEDDEPAPVDPGPGGADPGPGPGASPALTTKVFEYSKFQTTYTKLWAVPLTPPGEVLGVTWEPNWERYETARYFMGDLLGEMNRQAFQSEAPSRIEAALESLPNVANAEVVSLELIRNDDLWKWRIEITEGPGGLAYLHISGEELINPGGPGEHFLSDQTNIVYPLSLGAGRFQFDAVTSGALTPGVSEMDGADDAGADPVASVPAVDAWPWGVHLADPGGLDLLV